MLIITRKPGQRIRIDPHPSLSLDTPVGELLHCQAIEVVIFGISGLQVKLGIHAHPQLRILRVGPYPLSVPGPEQD